LSPSSCKGCRPLSVRKKEEKKKGKKGKHAGKCAAVLCFSYYHAKGSYAVPRYGFQKRKGGRATAAVLLFSFFTQIFDSGSSAIQLGERPEEKKRERKKRDVGKGEIYIPWSQRQPRRLSGGKSMLKKAREREKRRDNCRGRASPSSLKRNTP